MTPEEQKADDIAVTAGRDYRIVATFRDSRSDMKKLRSKMTTEELAESLGVARQTVNRWIRQQGWKTEGLNGVKGGRARLIHIDARVKEHIMSLPAIRNRQAVYHLAEATAYNAPLKPASGHN
jgi:excisionase family DNA binding protein